VPYNHISGRIAIFYPWGNLDTVPSLRNAAIMLADRGYKVEFYTLTDSNFPQPDFDNPAISVCSNQPEVFRDRGVVRPALAKFIPGRFCRYVASHFYRPMARRLSIEPDFRRRHASIPYIAIIGVDPEGLADAAPFADLLGVPLIYWSLELLFSDEIARKNQQTLKSREIVYSRRAAFTIIQDEWRAQALIEENGLDPARVLLVPNAPMGKAIRCSGNFLHERFNIPPERKIVLNAGTIRWWAMSEEIVATASYWREEYVLVMHSRQRSYGYGSEYVDSVVDKANPGRVIISFDAVSSDRYRSLVDSADVGIAFYNPYLSWSPSMPNKNLELMGLSSGKLSSYLHSGLPVVVNEAIGPRELVKTYDCGVCVSQASEIEEALKTIFERYDWYAENACRCFNERLEFGQYFEAVIKKIDGL
jgi:glycosyltransferase involved in cell wall biosynthesis